MDTPTGAETRPEREGGRGSEGERGAEGGRGVEEGRGGEGGRGAKVDHGTAPYVRCGDVYSLYLYMESRPRCSTFKSQQKKTVFSF